jgi:hypothetical protein
LVSEPDLRLSLHDFHHSFVSVTLGLFSTFGPNNLKVSARESAIPHGWCRSLHRQAGADLFFEVPLAPKTELRPRQCVQPLILNFVTAPNTCSEGAISNSLERCFNQAQNGPSLATSLEQRLLRHTDDAPVCAVLCGLGIQGLCFLLHPT